VNVVLISTYELGHQPFGLASPAAWLCRDGHQVRCFDLAVQRIEPDAVRRAGLIAFYLPMHTATRLALPVIQTVKQWNPEARLAAYGLYAPLNADLLEQNGVGAILGGEFESALARLANGQAVMSATSRERLQFVTPRRQGLPALTSYTRLRNHGQAVVTGYTEASRGCKHLCRHCPVVPVYQGEFRVVQRDVVLEDIRGQVASGARHITFGDPDFFNGPSHAIRIVEALHTEFPEVTYDATIKIEHLKKHRHLLAPLRDTGCLFVTSAVESVDDAVLEKLQKNHTRRDFCAVAEWMRDAGLVLQPTFIAFTPWTTRAGYAELLRTLRDLDLVENTAPIQLALRLLIPQGSRLLELEELRDRLQTFDAQSLVFPWKHSDPGVDLLGASVFRYVQESQHRQCSRAQIFSGLGSLVSDEPFPYEPAHERAVPHLDEPWYCCAEPAAAQVPLV
jgi:radical SAM superfamily enzyme YgiQ (UPF0313 family)